MGITYLDESPDKSSGITYLDDTQHPTQPEFDPFEEQRKQGNFLMGALKGASNISASIPIGMRASFEAMLAGEGTSGARQRYEQGKQELAQSFEQLADTKSTPFQVGQLGTEIAGTAAVQGPRVAIQGSRIADYLGKIASGAGAGAVGGAMVGQDPRTIGLGAGFGGAFSAAVPVASRLMTGNLDRARNALSRLLGGNTDEAQRVLAAASPDVTSAQALEMGGQLNPTAAAGMGILRGEVGNAPNPQEAADFYSNLTRQQQAERVGRIQAVTPDLEQALQQRSDLSDVAYGKAFAADEQRLGAIQQEQDFNDMMRALLKNNPDPIRVSPELAALERFPAIRAAAETVRKVNPDIGNPLASIQGLHAMKLAIDQQFANPMASTPLQNFTNSSLSGTKRELLSALEQVSPLYRVARTVHSQASPEINQAQILNEITNTLKGTAGKEDSLGFLRSLNREGVPFIKKANQQKRFDTLAEGITPEQLGTVNRAESELVRDINIAAKETDEAAMAAAQKIFETSGFRGKLPNMLNHWITLANTAIGAGEMVLSKKMYSLLDKAARDPKAMAELLATLPPEQRNAMLRYATQASGTAAPAVVGAATMDQQ